MTAEDLQQSEISRHIWQAKYRWGDAERCIADTWHRVARAVASVEPADQGQWDKRFYELLAGYRFLPGGRILAGAGTDRRVTLLNCFVMGVIEDSLEGIFDALKEGALTMQWGGGVGYDFSTLRPAGTVAQATGSIASGPVSFMHIWDAMCGTMLSTGSRRGAMMASLRCDHPDIERFVEAKREPQALRHFNLSVQVTDAFMEAVDQDAEWRLVFPAGGPVIRTIPARALWHKIMQAAYDVAEPGVLFVDRINRENNLGYSEQLTTTNPCGEVPLPAYGACNLGSLNLTRFVHQPFGRNATIDLDGLAAAAGLAVRFLDNVLDLSAYPLVRQAEQAQATRRIGLGITGLADALAMLGLRYDLQEGRMLAAEVMATVCHAAYRSSIALADEKGGFPGLRSDRYLASEFIQRLPGSIPQAIARQGIRNSHLLAIAPAGTISLLANNVSSGIEPIFRRAGERWVLGADGTRHSYPVHDFAWELWRRQRPGEAPPEVFIEAGSVAPQAHLEMQAALQPFVDNAISKTVNVAENFPFEPFADLYTYAFRAGLKGCTVFRPNPVTGAVLTAGRGHCCELDREAD